MPEEKSSEILPITIKDDFVIAELQKTVTSDNHNKMVHDILNQNNSRISSSKRKTPKPPNTKPKKPAKEEGAKEEVKKKEKKEEEKKKEKVKKIKEIKKVKPPTKVTIW